MEEEQGVTRDRKELSAEWSGVPFSIMDTGGWLAAGDSLEAKVSEQAERALAEADVILMVVDVTTGVTEEDLAAAKIIRRAGPPVRLVVNKVDGANRETAAWEFVSLGLGDPYPVSSLHGRGTGDLLDEVVALLPVPLPEDEEGSSALRVGKAVAGGTASRERRALPSSADPTSGSRRSSIVFWVRNARSCTTCRAPRATPSTLSSRRRTDRFGSSTLPVCADPPKPTVARNNTRRCAPCALLERADVAVLVIDATIGASHQDQRLAERIGVSGCPTIVALNKWDQVPIDDRDEVLAGVGDRLAFLGAAPVLKISALSGKGVQRILPALRDCVTAYHQRVPTGTLNRTVQELQNRQAAPRAKIRYIVQGAIDPPTFTLFTNGRLPQTYLRYLERGIRERFDLGATPMKLRVRIGGK